MTERMLTAMYDTPGAAESARNDLIARGIADTDITVRGTGASASGAPVGDDRSFWEELKDLFVPDEDRYTYAEGMKRGGYVLTVRVPEGQETVAEQVLERYDPVDIDTRIEEWRASGWRGYEGTVADQGAVADRNAAYSAYADTPRSDASYAGTDATTTTGTTATATGELTGEETIPVMEEQLRVGKREVAGGRVRVRSYVVERPVEEQVELRQERVTLERRPVDREVAPGDAAFQERTIEAVERGEEAVVSKSARVVEEVGIRKDVERETETVRDTVRRTEVEVEDERAGRGLGTTTGNPKADDLGGKRTP